MSNKETETYCPKSRADWRQWLAKNHASEQSVWLVYFRTSTKVASVTWSEAVDEALCFGWIDSTKKTIDEIEALVVPEDLAAALAHHKGAIDYFNGLSKSAKKILLHWVISAKRPETRQKRVLEIAENASENLKPKQFR